MAGGCLKFEVGASYKPTCFFYGHELFDDVLPSSLSGFLTMIAIDWRFGGADGGDT